MTAEHAAVVRTSSQRHRAHVLLLGTTHRRENLRRRTLGRVQGRRQHTELTRRVSKEADLSLTVLAVLACLGPVPGRVKPALKHSMSELTGITAATTTTAIRRTDRAGVVMLPGISPASLLSRMSKRTVGPVMAAATSTPTNLELVHPEMVRRVRVRIVVVVVAVIGQELLQEGLVGRRETRRVGEHVSGGTVLPVTAEEELPRWDVNVSEKLRFVRTEVVMVVVVGVAELVVLLRTNTAAHTLAWWVYAVYVYVGIGQNPKKQRIESGGVE